MKQQLVETFSFEELEDDVKTKIIEGSFDINVDYQDWCEWTIDDAKTIGALIGIDVENVYYSGFSSQGDGACFEGEYEYKKGGLKAVKDYAPIDHELHRIAKELQDLQSRYFYRLSARVFHSGRGDYHANSTKIDVYCGDEYANGESEDGIAEILRDYMHWIYNRLENEYEFLTSEEMIVETLTCDNVERFRADGTIF